MSVAKIQVHPSYKEAEDAGKSVGEAVQSSSDMAVLTLKTGKLQNEKGEELDRNTTPICLPTKADSEWIGEVPLAAGFGVDENGEEPDKLMGARVKIVNHDDCNKKRGGWNKKIKSQYHLCSIGYEDKMAGILKGDSGSALQVHE